MYSTCFELHDNEYNKLKIANTGVKYFCQFDSDVQNQTKIIAKNVAIISKLPIKFELILQGDKFQKKYIFTINKSNFAYIILAMAGFKKDRKDRGVFGNILRRLGFSRDEIVSLILSFAQFCPVYPVQ
jgi:hypothetical protein